jgi:hypothetical protein
VIQFTPLKKGLNTVSLKIQGIDFKNFVPKLNVIPDEIAKITLVNENGEAQSKIENQSVDNDFVVYFEATDQF